MKLTIELVPRMCWYSNVRTNVTREKWDIIRKECYRKSNYKCEICGDKGTTHPVECHEIWEYDDVNYVQKLIGFIALCPNCHSQTSTWTGKNTEGKKIKIKIHVDRKKQTQKATNKATTNQPTKQPTSKETNKTSNDYGDLFASTNTQAHNLIM